MTPLLQDKFISSSYTNQLDYIALEDRSSGTTRTTTTTTTSGSSSSNKCTTTSGNSSSNKWNEYICKFVQLLSTIIHFCSPLVLDLMMAILYDPIIVSAVGSGLFLFKILLLDLFLFKIGKIQNWPNKVSKEINKERNKSMLRVKYKSYTTSTDFMCVVVSYYMINKEKVPILLPAHVTNIFT
jgi:hypothetical protein